VGLLQSKPRADVQHVAAAGYCFGGTAVLQFAKLGGASAHGVAGVFSFHGGLSGLAAGNATFGNVRVFVANGAADAMIPMAAGTEFQEYMTNHSAKWEFATYGHAQHGFTHPTEGTGHFHYERIAEMRSWESMRDGLKDMGFLNRMSWAAAPAPAIATASVTYNDSGVSLSGYLAYPAGASGRLPVVIHVHTWNGLSDFERGRANRTAAELGHIGFAVSLFTDAETAQAQANMFAKVALVQSFTPELYASRLSAAVAYLRGHAMADLTRLGACGYCFGGTAVLQYARTGAATADGVLGVASFHGGLSGLDALPQKYCPTRVAIFNGAGDAMITDAQVTSVSSALEASKTHWEFTNYSNAQHGFTHPTDGTAHFHYDQMAEQRSWASMSDFLATTFAGEGRTSPASCVHAHAPNTTATPSPDPAGASTSPSPSLAGGNGGTLSPSPSPAGGTLSPSPSPAGGNGGTLSPSPSPAGGSGGTGSPTPTPMVTSTSLRKASWTPAAMAFVMAAPAARALA